MYDSNESENIISKNICSSSADQSNLNLTKINEDITAKLCVVCEDTALGFNFGALTCESCKAFFRRNALKSDKLHCVFGGNCNIDKNTRRFCTSCRLTKCQKLGMKKDFIMGDEEKRLRHEKARMNLEKKILKRLKKDGIVSLNTKSSFSNTERDQTTLISFLKHGQLNGRDKQSISGELLPSLGQSVNLDNRDRNTLPDVLEFTDDLSDFLISCSNGKSLYQHNEQFFTTSESLERNSNEEMLPYSRTDLFSPSVNYNQICLNENLSRSGQCRILTKEQWSDINSLRVAYESSFFATVCEEIPAGATTINTFVNRSGSIVKKMITFAKQFAQFLHLNQANQITLLRGVVGHTLLVISATHYDVESDLWKTPEGKKVPAKILTLVAQFNGLYEDHGQFCRLFRSLVGHDFQIIASMLVLCLFCPDNISVSERDRVSRTHDHFVLLLKHYLEAQYGYRESRTLLPGVLDCIDKMQRIVDNHSKMLIYVDPNQIDPLMLEILDIQAKRKFVAMLNRHLPNENCHSA